MKVTSRFQLDRAGVKKLGRTREMEARLRNEAEDMAREAKRMARNEAYDSGNYHDGIDADSGIEGGTAIGRVNAHDFKSWWIEAGTSVHRPKAILRRASEATGARTKGT